MFLSTLSTLAATVTINGSTSTISDGDFFAIFGAIFGAIMIPIIVVAILSIVAMWMLFTKCGEAGWKSIIPIYNLVVMLQIVGISPLWILVLFVPVVGSIIFLIVTIAADIRLAKGFGKSEGFAVGLILLNFILL